LPILIYPTCIWPLKVTPQEFGQDLLHQKTEVPGLLRGIVSVILCLAILAQYRLVADGRRYNKHDNSIYLTSIASHGKKWPDPSVASLQHFCTTLQTDPYSTPCYQRRHLVRNFHQNRFAPIANNKTEHISPTKYSTNHRVDSMVHDVAIFCWIQFPLVCPTSLLHVGRLSRDRQRRLGVCRIEHVARPRERHKLAAVRMTCVLRIAVFSCATRATKLILA